MRLPDAEGFIVAAQKLLNNHEAVFLHDAEGAPCAVLVTTELHRRSGEALGRPFLDHSHLEAGEDVPWIDDDLTDEPPPPVPIPPSKWGPEHPSYDKMGQ